MNMKEPGKLAVESAKLAMSEREAAAAIGVSGRTLYTLRAAGELPFFRVGGRVMYSVPALQEWIKSRLQNSNA